MIKLVLSEGAMGSGSEVQHDFTFGGRMILFLSNLGQLNYNMLVPCPDPSPPEHLSLGIYIILLYRYLHSKVVSITQSSGV